MSGASNTGGPLSPLTEPLNDAALDAVLQSFVSSVTGIPGSLVRPRWQPSLPIMPEASVNWCSIGIISNTPDGPPMVASDGLGDAVTLTRQAELQLLCSFYGPAAQRYATDLRDGVLFGQNRAMLQTNGMDVRRLSELITLPHLINTLWQRRYDLTLYIGINTTRLYNILSILSAQGTVEGDTFTSSFNTETSQ